MNEHRISHEDFLMHASFIHKAATDHQQEGLTLSLSLCRICSAVHSFGFANEVHQTNFLWY